MSQPIYVFLGIATVACTGLFIAGIPEVLAERPPENLLQFYSGVGVFTAVLTNIAVFCFFPRSRAVTLRIIGVVGLLGSLFQVVEGLHNRSFGKLFPALFIWMPGSICLIFHGNLGD